MSAISTQLLRFFKTMTSPTHLPFPKLHILLISPTAVNAFIDAKNTYLSELNDDFYSIHEASLSQLEDAVKFDLVVSPANSHGILDGGFDDAISRAFSPRNDYFALTRLTQDKLHQDWKGFAPPGTCTLVRIPDEWASAEGDSHSKNVWGTKHLALLPTMRVPNNVNWDREVVYECIWSLLNAVYNHNAAAEAAGTEKIESLLMSPLATGAGYVPEKRWANQLCLAIKHFMAAVNKPEKGDGKPRTTWPEAFGPTHEVAATWRKEGGNMSDY